YDVLTLELSLAELLGRVLRGVFHEEPPCSLSLSTRKARSLSLAQVPDKGSCAGYDDAPGPGWMPDHGGVRRGGCSRGHPPETGNSELNSARSSSRPERTNRWSAVLPPSRKTRRTPSPQEYPVSTWWPVGRCFHRAGWTTWNSSVPLSLVTTWVRWRCAVSARSALVAVFMCWLPLSLRNRPRPIRPRTRSRAGTRRTAAAYPT